MKSYKNRKAFTIVEMVIVIAVIAILAAAMIPAVSGVIRQANISADRQFAASLNIQLAMESVDREIQNENDLKDVINKFYGADYFETQLSPKSAKHGYYFWYDYTNKTVIVGTTEEIADLAAHTPTAPTMSAVPMIGGGKGTFSPASLRSDLIPGYYLLGCKGGVLSTIAKLEGLDDEQAYEDALNQLKATEDTLEQKLFGKVSVTTLETDYGIFACEGAQEYWYRSVSTTEVDDKIVYMYYPDKVVDDVEGVVEETDKDPENPPIKVAPGGIEIEISSDTKVGDGAWSGLFDGKVEVHVNVANKEELKDIFHMGAMDSNMIIVVPGGVLPNGNECYFDPDNAFEIVYDDENGDKKLVVEVKPQGGMESINVEITYNNSGNVGADADYFYEGALYLAWDFGSAKLTLKDKLSNSLVDWTVTGDAPIEVNKGVITLKAGAKPDAKKSFATITATLKKDPAKTHSINVQLVFPTTLTWKLDGTTHTAPATNGAFDLSYTEATEFALALDAVGDTQSGYVKLQNTEFAINFATSGTLFTIENNKTLRLDPAKIATNPTQTITVTYGTADHTYISQTYTVTVKDNSSVGLKKNQIATGVTMGDYLFRVGNGNTFSLGKLFSAVEAGKAVKIESVNIYDASKSTGTNGRVAIATSGTGFAATYTANSDWTKSTVKFSGTGVAIIEVVTAKGATELAVEVVEGYNITDASQLKSDANNILLNDIKLASDGTFSLTGDAINHKILYGNGFKFDITAGRKSGNGIINLNNADLDNVRIIGGVYTDYATSSTKDYYSSAVYIGGSARISNSYIFGTRTNIFAKADLEIVNTVLDCARFANINVENGTLTIDGLTTINEPNASNSNVAGMGIVFNDGAAASSKIVVKGDLKQYNWICEADEKYMPSVTGLSTFIDEIFANTEYIHTINNVKYVNLGIICMDADVSVSNVAYPTSYSSKVVSKLGQTGFVVSVRNDQYSATANDLTYRINAYTWTPDVQAITVPTITWSKYSNGFADVTFEKGQSGEFDPNVFTAQKYGVALTHTITANGTNYTGKKITFTEDQTCVITYTVKDNKVYNNNGVATDDTESYTYTLVVNVVTTDPKQKEPEFNFTNATGTKEVVYNGKTYKVPEFTDSSKFFHVGNGIYAPIVDVKIKDNSSDFTGYYPIFGGVSITWYNTSGTATTYNATSNLSAMPAGLEWITSVASLKGGTSDWDGYAKYDNGLCRKSAADGSTNSGDTYKTVEFSFQAEGCEKYYYYIRFREPAHTCPSGGCVTPDTLVMLADGTQKEIQYVTYEDQLMVWNFYEGKYETVPAAIIFDMGTDYFDVLTLVFDDGTTVKTINGHRFFDKTANAFALINTANVADFVGHEFVKVDGDSYKTVKLVDYCVVNEYTTSYSIMSAYYYNFIVEGMLSDTFHKDDAPLFDYFQIGDNMMYDADQLKADVEKYGLYTYEEFADYLTYEQFAALNVQYLKIAVEKGQFTYEGILDLINTYLQG